MNAKISMNHKFRRALANVFALFAILALVLPAAGAVSAQEMPSPYLRAFPDGNYVDGYNWPAGELVHLDIEGNDFEPVTAGEDGTVGFDLAGYDLERGASLSMSSDDIVVNYTVRNLLVDNTDLENQTVSGTVDLGSGETVHVWAPEADTYVQTNEDGTWSADLSGLLPGTCGNAEAWGDPNSSSSTIIDWCVPYPEPWRDDFDSLSPILGWYWKNGDSGQWSLVDGYLRLIASDQSTPFGNLLLRGAANGDFSIETRLFNFDPDSNYQFAGLVIFQDDGNFLQYGRAYCDVPGSCVGNGLYFDEIGDGGWIDGNFATMVDSPSEVYLRLERRGDMVRALYSYEGITWFEIGYHYLPSGFTVNGVGLAASQDINHMGISADFDYFEMTEGWGFLPVGFHDYDGGDVPSWNCGAGGWATDPDDPVADLAIEIDVDGTALPDWLYAGEVREDLDNAGVCADGSCAFYMNLWDVISSYETHNITAYSQDIPSGEWVRLSNSPKDLTCRTYDIYSYDPLTGSTLMLANLPDTHEFSPSWSPNGKMIAYDVVDLDFHEVGIYLTDVKTGESNFLEGSAGGNDAAWSPNGKWIVFDRAPVGDASLYILPSAGGDPTLIRENAISADWAPSGKRLVFVDTSDGSIRTVAADGSKGGETIVAAGGANPVWSPDGDWVAYESDGDLWKVPVNVLGRVIGDPVQLTSGPFNDGMPTWSPDSLTIAYHTGFTGDWDIWTVPAEGGMATWLTGAPVFGDYDPSYAKDSPILAYSSFSPEGQASRTWVAAYTYDAGTWDEGSHTYQFWTEGAPSGDEFSFDVTSEAPSYDGDILIRPNFSLRAQTAEGCMDVPDINPNQETRFHVGWTFDGLYSDALTSYDGLNIQVRWDTSDPADMVRHEIFPFTLPGDWPAYVCTFTAP